MPIRPGASGRDTGTLPSRAHPNGVPEDLPSDVLSVLKQLLSEGQTAIRAGDIDTAREIVETTATVSRNKLPDGELRGQLLHGCGEVTEALTPTGDVEADVAAEYLRAMARRLPGAPT